MWSLNGNVSNWIVGSKAAAYIIMDDAFSMKLHLHGLDVKMFIEGQSTHAI